MIQVKYSILKESTKYSFENIGFEVLTVVIIKSSIFWDIMPCHLLKINDIISQKIKLFNF
jgi:hypothetical protein